MAVKVNLETLKLYSLSALSKKKKIQGGDSGLLTKKGTTVFKK